MKPISKILSISLIASGVALFAGCAAFTKTQDKAATWATTPSATNIVTVTNIVERVDPVSHVTNYVQTIQERTNIVYVAKPFIQGGIDIGGQVAPFIPPPYGTAATAILGVLSAGLAFLVKKKNNQNADLNDTITAVVKGVEKATAPGATVSGPAVKDSISQASKDAGVSDLLHNIVTKVTS